MRFFVFNIQIQNYSGDEELCCVYVPTNHLYIGDIFLVNAKDVIRPNLSVREGIGKRSFHRQILLKIYALSCSISVSFFPVQF